MTDEERQKLITGLDVLTAFLAVNKAAAEICMKAAREIERLAAELEESRKKEMKFRTQEPREWIITDD
jgi:hypothetical protein